MEDADGAAIGGVDAFANDDLNEIAAKRASDANIDELATEAQAAVRADDNRYVVDTDVDPATVATYEFDADAETWSDGTTTLDPTVEADQEVIAEFQTARQLQSQYNAAVSTLNGDVAGSGATLEIASSLSNSIGSFLAQNDTLEAELQAVRDDYIAVVNAIEAGGDGSGELADWKVSVDAAIDAAFTADVATDGRASVDADEANEDLPSAIVDGLLSLNTRFTNDERVEDTKAIFEATESGADFVLAEELQDRREDEDASLNTASDLINALEGLKGEYDNAVTAAEGAAEELGYEVVTVDDGIMFGEADQDELFIFNAESLDDASITDVTLDELEAGDALFFGTEYQLGGETGDNNVLEFFTSTNTAGDVVIDVENSAFGSAQNDDYSVTLTGISEDQLNIEGGVVSIVEVA